MIKIYKPTSPGRRNQTILISESNNKRTDKKILKKFSKSVHRKAGRSHGRISVYQKRVGAKRRYRVIDFKRNKFNIEAKVVSIDYDPNRTCDIALISYADGEKAYILRPNDLNVNDVVMSGEKLEAKVGNTMQMKNIPIGLPVHNIELYPNAGGKFVRSAGTAAYITAKEGKYVNVRMPSGEVRRFLGDCKATIGQLGRDEWKLVKLGKAGRNFHLGKRPKTRGKARSDSHPLAGSYSRRVGRHPVDKWGNLSKGKKTRRRKHTNKYIVKDRRVK